MLNGVTSVNVNNQNYQTNFKAREKGLGSLKDCVKFFDEIAMQRPREIRDMQRPLEEQIEAMRIKSVSIAVKNRLLKYIDKLFNIFGESSKNKKYTEYEKKIKKAVEDGVIDADEACTLLANKYSETMPEVNKLIETANEAQRKIYLDELKKNDPELYEAVLRKETDEKYSFLSNWEILKQFLKTAGK